MALEGVYYVSSLQVNRAEGLFFQDFQQVSKPYGERPVATTDTYFQTNLIKLT